LTVYAFRGADVVRVRARLAVRGDVVTEEDRHLRTEIGPAVALVQWHSTTVQIILGTRGTVAFKVIEVHESALSTLSLRCVTRGKSYGDSGQAL